jgi:tRNA nucleotidyltransferase/poly(A) polymerase
MRGFTMNALYFNLKDLTVIDPLGRAIKDIENKVVNTCTPTSLQEDPLRMLRAITYAATHDF